MVFSAPIFLFGFLPIVLFIYYLTPQTYKNIILLISSLCFYAWGEVFYLGVMLISILSNYMIGRLISDAQANNKNAFFYLILGSIINIGLLISFKYSDFINDNINEILSLLSFSTIHLEPVHLPLGISFFTFQALSYIVDVYRKTVSVQKNIYHLALYISLFPQLIAGPIVRYHDIASQITQRRHSTTLFASGVQRFIIGLAKKMLLANPLGEVADQVFLLSGNDLTMPLAWIGILAYTLQIYFDFSGYSDMAIGLGRMFGFRFQENFNYPYMAKSLREFWRRWHISLSTWFRDYVYIPLGGNRVSSVRVYLNLFLVFFLTGLWHGASWNFIVWGLFHGVFLASEHRGFSKILNKAWQPLQHFYLLFVIIISWVFFRAETLTQAMTYLNRLFNINHWQTTTFQYAQVISSDLLPIFIIALIGSLPIYKMLNYYLLIYSKHSPFKMALLIYLPKLIALSALFILSALKIAASTYNPFIYFRF
ncbi:MAG: MBOAT family protein [Gammaproteobacteria bacterium]|nr:MBOAT family protein [Gammaproteobacteria bacterium]